MKATSANRCTRLVPPKKEEGDQASALIRKIVDVLTSPPSLLVVDDDESFTRIIAKTAQRENLPMTVCHSIKEVGRLREWKFDVAIIDYDLGDFTGLQLTDILARLRELPVVLVSQYRQIDTKRWPECVRAFVNKSVGPDGVLEMALRAHQQQMKRTNGDGDNPGT